MARQVNIHDAKTHLSELISAVERGEEVVIARRGEPVAKIVACGAGEKGRTLGFAAGLVQEIDPEWHRPLSDAEIRDWFGDEYADLAGG